MDFCHEETLNQLKEWSQEKKNDYLIVCSGSAFQCVGDLMPLLIKAGANVNCAAHDGTTPLMEAVSKSEIARVALLIHAGADLGALNNKNETAFFKAMLTIDSKALYVLSYMISPSQIENELRLNQLRLATSGYFCPTLEQFFSDVTRQKRNQTFQTWCFLLGNREHTKNPFSLLPMELKSLIYFKYDAMTKKRLLEKYCFSFERNNLCYTSPMPRPIIFSQDENFRQKFSLLSVEEPDSEPNHITKKSKRKGCIIS